MHTAAVNVLELVLPLVMYRSVADRCRAKGWKGHKKCAPQLVQSWGNKSKHVAYTFNFRYDVDIPISRDILSEWYAIFISYNFIV